MKCVLKLVEPYFNSGRCITGDNFFSGVKLCEQLYEKKLTYIGTLRANKTEIPQVFLADKHKSEQSSMFGFNKYLTLTSYVPKEKKVVLVISTHHHDCKIDTESNQPQTIIDYNQTKGGVDTFDHLLALNSCRRKTNRWTLNCFMFMIDAACQNAFSLFKLKSKRFNQPLSKNYAKDDGLEEIGKSLIHSNISSRIEVAKSLKYQHISKSR